MPGVADFAGGGLAIATLTCAVLFFEESLNENRSIMAIIDQFLHERSSEPTERPPSIFTVRQRIKYLVANPLMRAGW